ncbi:MAG: hypothetical protein U5P10_07985 [Spirochaetia bacterium]|nr:hypothetical protein [Spirochaetia bacterium]
MDGSYESQSSSNLSFNFDGYLQDAQVVREFVETQFRAAKEKDFDMSVTVTFSESLDLSEEESKTVSTTLTKLGLGAANVHLSAEFSDEE